MELDDREQQILAAIERQFYQEDPDLAHAVRNIDRPVRFGIKLSAFGTAIGGVAMILFFTVNTIAALAGFVLTVVSATALTHAIRARSGTVDTVEEPTSEIRTGIFRRFRRS